MHEDDRLKHRDCGWDEEALFDHIDGALPEGRARAFERHLAECAACRLDVDSYRRLERDLDAMAPLAPRPGFDAHVLEAVLGPVMPVPSAQATRPRRGWLGALAGSSRPVKAGIFAAAVLSLAGMVSVILYAGSLGGVGELAEHTVLTVVRGGADMIAAGAAQVLTAVRVSDALFNVARSLEPIWGSFQLAAQAVGPEFWLFSTFLSLLALMGAVRLATGSAVEREVRRVCLVL
jgi:anti-sigma factor RsiW